MPTSSFIPAPALLTAALLLPIGSALAAQTPQEAATDESATGLPSPQTWETGPDRETLVRFARAWGLVSGVLQTDAPETSPLDDAVAEPEELASDVSRQVRRHIRNNGLDQDQWAALIARMERDPDFRTRVEMLAIPYQTPTN